MSFAALDDGTRTRWLDWSSKQGRILTGGGKATALYTAERGFPFDASELPHHHLSNGNTHEVFARWRNSDVSGPCHQDAGAWLTGAWGRSIFVGGSEHTDEQSESCFNLQSPTLFIDIRIPKRHGVEFASSVAQLSDEQLRLLSRQHAFSGFTRRSVGDDSIADGLDVGALICTRHHIIDWNYLGVPRPRPNKWLAEPIEGTDGGDVDGNGGSSAAVAAAAGSVSKWKEWSYARGDHGQSYYMEQWYSLDGEALDGSAAAGGGRALLAMRATKESVAGEGRDACVVVVGDRFNCARLLSL